MAGAETELEYDNVYQLLSPSCSRRRRPMSASTAPPRPLFEKIKTPAQMMALGEKRLIGYIKTIGLFRMKAKNVIALSRLLIEKHGGEVPHSHEELTELPGVGRKTANVVMNVAFGEATIAVDTHIFRVVQTAPASRPARTRSRSN